MELTIVLIGVTFTFDLEESTNRVVALRLTFTTLLCVLSVFTFCNCRTRERVHSLIFIVCGSNHDTVFSTLICIPFVHSLTISGFSLFENPVPGRSVEVHRETAVQD